ncbi:MAG: hypothetical protein HZA59_06210 [Hydrogenophilales bacterium]|nr:hypothetical protein [Hydrogenophilales bacterium]
MNTNRVFGRVLVIETNVGVPNVQVVIYDVDPTCAQNFVSSLGIPQTGVATADRLGSVLTDAQGAFELTFDDEIFAARDPEGRPDLVLVVLAPEDSRSAKDPSTPPPDSRVLLVSHVPRVNAGRTEAYVLRIAAETLRKHHIPFSGPGADHDVVAKAKRLTDSYAEQDLLEKTVQTALGPRRKEQLQRKEATSQKAKRFVESLSAAPAKARGQKTFLTRGGDLASAQREAMERGLYAMKNAVGSDKVLLDITSADFTKADVDTAMLLKGGTTKIQLDRAQICQLLHQRRDGVAMVRIRNLLDAKKEEARERARLAAATGPAVVPPSDGGTPPSPGDAPGAADTVRAGVLGQLAELTAPAPNPAGSIEELAARLTGVVLPSGPADVTAFHDFHQLQIAFEHVWTEAFDERLKGRVHELYESIVKLHEEFGVPLDLPVEAAEQDALIDFLNRVSGQVEAMGEGAPDAVKLRLPSAVAIWHLFSLIQQAKLEDIAEELNDLMQFRSGLTEGQIRYRLDRQGTILAQAHAIISSPAGSAGRVLRLLDETRKQLTEPYSFHYFAPNSVNFGILLTYRQKWEPLTYQVGDLVGTIPMTPGEVRKYSTQTIIKRTRSQKELEKALSSRSGESSMTQRADAEITAKASASTNFKSTSQGSFDIGIGSLAASAEFVFNQAQESARVKKDFREAVVKAAQEYKQERALEIQTTDEMTTDSSTSGELHNPNNELTVTYLLYELERQYHISERIHRVMPVILVAQDVPAPNEITESWLLANEWILRRVLLDDGLQPALGKLKESFAGDELGVSIKRANWETQRRVVEKLEATVSDLLSVRDTLRVGLVSSEESRARAAAAEDAQGWFSDLAEDLVSGDPDEMSRDVLDARVKSIQKQLDYLQESLTDSQKQLATAREALDSATRAYTEAIENQTNRRVAIDQLRVHVKENILYYMQAIWDHEPPDQRFFRLYYQDVELPETSTTDISAFGIRRATPEEIARGVPTVRRGREFYVIEGWTPPAPGHHGVTKKLVEIADLDRPLGYKGNYIIFPLKTCVYLTEFMMRQFIDNYFGVRDPDEDSNFTTDELLDYVEAVWHDPAISLTDAEREALHALVLDRIREPRRDTDLVVVPTGQIYIEALLGSHPLLEQFKLIHRAYDTGKARAELRQAELENLRRAARLLAETPDLSDPDIDKQVRVEGVSSVVVDPD